MKTYADIAERVRALLDDQQGYTYTNDFIRPFVNQAQDDLVGYLISGGVARLRFHTQEHILVPAGVTKITDVPTMTLQNLMSASGTFVIGATAAQWRAVGGAVTNTGVATNGPTGALDAYPLTFAASTMLFKTADVLQIGPDRRSGAGFSIWMSATVPCVVQLSLGYADLPTSATMTKTYTVEVAVDATFRRYFISTEVDASAGATTAVLACGIDPGNTGAGYILLVSRAVLNNTGVDAGDVVTTTYPLALSSSGVLPPGLVTPDRVYEGPVGGAPQEMRVVRGPMKIPITAQSNTINYWDWYGGELHFLGATQDREIAMDYYGRPQDFPGVGGTGTMVNLPVAIPDAVNAIVYLTASLCANAKGQQALANTYAEYTPDGIGGKAGFAIEQMVNAEVKATQSVSLTRQPLNAARYQRRIGGY